MRGLMSVSWTQTKMRRAIDRPQLKSLWDERRRNKRYFWLLLELNVEADETGDCRACH